MHDHSRTSGSFQKYIGSSTSCVGKAQDIAVPYEELSERYQKLLQHNQWLTELGEKIAGMLQHECVDALLEHIAEELVRTSCANGAYMHMVHETGDYLHISAGCGPLKGELLGGRREKGFGLSAGVWQSGSAKFVADYNSHPDCVLELDTPIQAVSLPLFFAEEVLGVVFVTAEQNLPLQEELNFLKQIAMIASLSIYQAKQREAVSRDLYRTQSLSLITGKMHDNQDWDGMVYEICPMLMDAFDIERLSLYHADSSKETLIPHQSWMLTSSGIEETASMPAELVEQSVCSWCFANKESAHIARGVEDSRESSEVHAMRKQLKVGATLCVPVMSNSRVWGILKLCRSHDRRDFNENEINTVYSVIDQMSTALQRDELIRTVQHQALHDSLTGLPNRRGLEEYVKNILERSGEADVKKAVLFFDLDGFKEINDTHGHAAGDAVLQQVAQRMVACEVSDGILARLGGDEFAVVLPSIESQDEAL